GGRVALRQPTLRGEPRPTRGGTVLDRPQLLGVLQLGSLTGDPEAGQLVLQRLPSNPFPLVDEPEGRGEILGLDGVLLLLKGELLAVDAETLLLETDTGESESVVLLREPDLLPVLALGLEKLPPEGLLGGLVALELAEE